MGESGSVDKPKRKVGKRPTPTERVYLHNRCGGQTMVAEGHFERICDPFWPCLLTYCATCRRPVPLREIRWADSMESIVKYRRRVRRKTPTALRVWRSGMGWVVGGVPGSIFGVVMAIKKNPDNIAYQALGGFLVGGLALQFVGTFILNLIYRFDYRRVK